MLCQLINLCKEINIPFNPEEFLVNKATEEGLRSNCKCSVKNLLQEIPSSTLTDDLEALDRIVGDEGSSQSYLTETKWVNKQRPDKTISTRGLISVDHIKAAGADEYKEEIKHRSCHCDEQTKMKGAAVTNKQNILWSKPKANFATNKRPFTKIKAERNVSIDNMKPERFASINQVKPDRSIANERVKPERNVSIEKVKPVRYSSIDRVSLGRDTSIDQTTSDKYDSLDKGKPDRRSSINSGIPDRCGSLDKRQPERRSSIDPGTDRYGSLDKEKPDRRPSIGEATPDNYRSLDNGKPDKRDSNDPGKPDRCASIDQVQIKEKQLVDSMEPIQQEKPPCELYFLKN